MAFRLPRLPRDTKIAGADGKPSLEFQRWWQSVVTSIETQEAAQDALLEQIIAARAAAGTYIVGPATATIEAQTNGTPTSGELPATFTFTLYQDAVEIDDSGITWSATVSLGTATIAITDGVLTLSALTSNEAVVMVTAVYGDITRTVNFRIVKRIAAPDLNTGTGGTSATDNSFEDVDSATYIPVTDPMNITTGTVGEVELAAPLTIDTPTSTPSGSYNVLLRWQQDVSGVWTDVGSEATGTPAEGLGIPGTVTANETLTGLTASTAYSFRLTAKKDTADIVTRYLTGTASATGS